MKPLQSSVADDNTKWLNSIRFPIDSTDTDEFEKQFYKRHSDIEPQQKHNPLSGSVITMPLGEALFEFVYADFVSLYEEVKIRLYNHEEIELPTADSALKESINRFISYRAYKDIINRLAFGSTASAVFPPTIRSNADLGEAMLN